MNEFPKRFDHQSEEPKIYEAWLNSGGFSPNSEAPREPRSILMPPPNANAPIHVGHAYEVAIEDTLTRYWRMRGHKTLWQPGADHAGFETQVVFERKLEKEGRSRFGMDRQDLYNEIFAFSKENQKTVRHQLERLGASCDWNRFKFTLDPEMVAVVYKTFKQLYEDGLIYRAKRPIHWCVKHQTTLSDLEVKEEERTDTLYYLKYGPLTVATVRPETVFGDVAVAVHPEDERYRDYIGKTIEVAMPHKTVTLPVIADEYVNPEFGTGALKITPAHDPNDFEIAERHSFPAIEAIDQYGKLTDVTGPYVGLKIREAREKVVADMEASGMLVKSEPYAHVVKVCYKCNGVIEPRILDQWWLALTKPGKSGKVLRDLAVEAVTSGETKFLTERFENQFTRWMEGLRDWPLSRQIAWGIQLPVWYGPNGEVAVTAGEVPEGDGWMRDPDVFDTWFSSCQWPFSTLGTEGDLGTFYPTTAMVTGYDILFFWVSRMLMLSIYTQGQTPYRIIYLHGLVRDKDRQKMSKSKGNVLDPLGVADDYGADALRLALLFGTAAGTDPVIGDEKIRGMRNFGTKLWNIARFIRLSTAENTKAEFIAVTDADHAIEKKLRALTDKITTDMETYNLHLALESLYQFIWHDLADTYIEQAKEQLQRDDQKASTEGNLHYVLKQSLSLLHPFSPFVTEGVWREFCFAEGCLMNETWPELTSAV